ncbi:sugar ABC transporter substrate-binding protein [Rhodophyticola sp. CCM32]|uniref:substrate-binding domain-containing protein n=1 Tax=Rhodophyticola sp. CCM32 TaxID=2916397 RepID=UPI00107F808A|nr:substrate-binding domain-containing protein [Rhodophyticola sp. CCM32]QBY00061.1 sugar ABC transporter substrate-binding protein [Rhodophyticola sp. CCM32]
MRIFKTAALAVTAGLCTGAGFAQDTTGYDGVPRTFLWNPGSVEIYDASEHAQDGPYTIGFSNASISNPWRVAMLHGIEAAAERHAEQLERFIITDAGDDPSTQAADIQDLIAQGVDILLVSPVTAEALEPAIRRASRSGVPVVLVDRAVSSDENYITFVTASDQALGRISAQWLAETLNFEGDVVMLGGLAGASPAENRIAAAMEVFNQYPGINVLDTQYTSWSPANGRTIMQALIQRHGDAIDGVWADSGLQGSGSIEAFIGAGYEDGQIPPHTGGDFNAMYQLSVQHDVPMVGVDYPPAMGARAFEVLFEVLEGAGIPRRIEVNQQVVVSRDHETASVQADVYVDEYALMDAPGSVIMSSGVGPDYNPETFSAVYPR